MPAHEIQRTAPAKINLNLFITGVREDGFHELDTLFLKLRAPADTIHIVPANPGQGLVLDCPIPGLVPENNIIYKAWEKLGSLTGFRPDLHIRVTKRIPQGMGLGGGSADAGVVLRELNRLAGDRGLEQSRLIALGASLGADVPLFLLDAPAAHATGIGEKLCPASPDLSGFTLVLACPPVHVNTAWAYSEWDRKNPAPTVLTSVPLGTKKSAPESGLLLHNDFEQVVFAAFPRLREIKECLLSAGASGAAMSGSGAGIFALFRDHTQARNAAARLRRKDVPCHTQSFDAGV
ncbi:4-diphosphocytidyl-2-C-methyl-D-erythritol kinase [Paucidesulfovibrio gracilis DSM 16080]|uniref:4-diphosphocytidyl-2-C-methyl-D-erythritol kinase n=1 Tax=Paucidesulfovibrio gracilis DSM 16080 TaxID=1121449 RepID=A0A1T4W5M3_9BACT|nr:4-(cytidine 5'-diphospho)-2-C-methyl-D-erythritol kinase [Paucidesulfovibrio gracilis]SKA72001.1 4-diphosphocytidyl-2-C-methyl-D-erythritol kinase [Paucidesulfovibrio gracilis DSM 16080]